MRTALPLLAFLALALALATPLAACGGRVTVDGTSTGTPSAGTGGTGTTSGTSVVGVGVGGTEPVPLHLGQFHADCAPNDGPATLFVIDDLAGCGPISAQVTLTEITVFGAELANVVAGGTVTLSGNPNDGADGDVITPGPGGASSITQVTSGTLHFGSFTAGQSAGGIYELTLSDGSHVSGAFSLTGCPGGGQCG